MGFVGIPERGRAQAPEEDNEHQRGESEGAGEPQGWAFWRIRLQCLTSLPRSATSAK